MHGNSHGTWACTVEQLCLLLRCTSSLTTGKFGVYEHDSCNLVCGNGQLPRLRNVLTSLAANGVTSHHPTPAIQTVSPSKDVHRRWSSYMFILVFILSIACYFVHGCYSILSRISNFVRRLVTCTYGGRVSVIRQALIWYHNLCVMLKEYVPHCDVCRCTRGRMFRRRVPFEG